MSDAVFPEFDGTMIEIERGAEWQTTTKESWSGVKTRVAHRPWPVWLYTLKVDVLRLEYSEVTALEAFFNAHRGAFESFLFRDPDYYSVIDQPFGVCDGATTVFQLSRAVGSWIEPVWAPAASPVIKRNGTPLVVVADYTLGTNGLVQLNTAYPSGTLTWSGDYYMRVCFKEDKMSLQQIMKGFWKAGKIQLESEVFPT
jgi:hypothetical protein